MASLIEGADAPGLERLAGQMNVSAERLEAIRSGLTGLLNRSPWDGPDAEHFRGQWQHRLSGLMQLAVTAAREASERLRHNAIQQRAASGAEGGGPSARHSAHVTTATTTAPQGVDAVDFAKALFGPAAQLMLIPDLLKVAAGFKHAPDIAKFVNNPLVHKLIGDRHLLLGKFEPGPLALIGLVSDLNTYLGESNNPDGIASYKARIDVAFDVAEIATVWCPPATVIIGGVHLLYDVSEALYPGVGKAVAEGVADAAAGVWSTATDVVGDAAEAVGDAAEAVGDVAQAVGDAFSGGVNAVRGLFHW